MRWITERPRQAIAAAVALLVVVALSVAVLGSSGAPDPATAAGGAATERRLAGVQERARTAEAARGEADRRARRLETAVERSAALAVRYRRRAHRAERAVKSLRRERSARKSRRS